MMWKLQCHLQCYHEYAEMIEQSLRIKLEPHLITFSVLSLLVTCFVSSVSSILTYMDTLEI